MGWRVSAWSGSTGPSGPVRIETEKYQTIVCLFLQADLTEN
jgi:hypothetical protein